jgi:hypothetical protein
VDKRLDIDGRKYERRRRHKTKADKYDLKARSKRQDTVIDVVNKSGLSKKRKKKSGVVLNENFRAPNVAQERLTLRVTGGPGIFKNAKASSPVRRRGLPDLTFSEMNFLGRRQDHDDAQRRLLMSERARKRKRKDEGQNQLLSQYFDDLHAPAESKGPVARNQTQATFRRPARLPSPSPLTASSGDLFFKEENERDKFFETRKDCLSISPEPRPAESAHHKAVQRPASRETTIYSWSITPPRRCRNDGVAPRAGPGDAADQHHVASRAQHQPVADYPISAVHTQSDKGEKIITEESSVSQLSIDEFTRSTLLGSRQALWDRLAAPSRATELYTLADLKSLVRVERLEDHSPRDDHICSKSLYTRPSSCLGSKETSIQKATASGCVDARKELLTSGKYHSPSHSTTLSYDKVGGVCDLLEPTLPSAASILRASSVQRGKKSASENHRRYSSAAGDGQHAVSSILQGHRGIDVVQQSKSGPNLSATAQQIIWDMEQEELLVKQRQAEEDEAVGAASDGAPGRESTPLTGARFPSSPLLTGCDSGGPTTQEHETSACGREMYQHQQFRQNFCSPSFPRVKLDRCEPGSLVVNDTRDRVAASRSPSQLQQPARLMLAVGPWQDQHNEQAGLTDFWRPNILY